MTTEQSQPSFASLHDEEFVVLTTYRASGVAVPTTVWFADADGTIYVTTQRGAGKARRIGANPQVLLTPSDRVGNTHGEAVAGRARLLASDENAAAVAALRAKYPAYDAMATQMDASREVNDRVFLAITPA